MSRQISWPRIVAEGAVIVVSILLALAAEDWRDGLDERRQESQALARLDAEFAAVDSVMREWYEHHRGVLAAGEILLEHTGPQAPPTLSADSIGRLLGIVQFTWTLDAPSGVLSSIIASGELSLIRDPALRAALASWQALLDDLHGDEAMALELVNRQLGPYLDEHTSYRTVVALQGDYPTTASRFPDGLRSVLSQRQFENILQGRVYNTFWILRSYEAAFASLGTIRRLLVSPSTR